LENFTVTYKDRNIPFALIRKKVKNINLKVRQDQTVVVSANNAVPYHTIEKFVIQKAPWILKNLELFAAMNKVDRVRDYASGETLYYLGDPYRLQVLPAEKKPRVLFEHGQIYLIVKDISDQASKEKLTKSWYREQAEIIFRQSLARIHPLIVGYGIAEPSLTIRNMKTRWGSCSWKKGKITLSTELLKTAERCIDYVVLHELAHFLHHKHDVSFYNFLSEIMPDWKERRAILRNFAKDIIDR
jgi:predicted metal-dependent hydrolase